MFFLLRGIYTINTRYLVLYVQYQDLFIIRCQIYMKCVQNECMVETQSLGSKKKRRKKARLNNQNHETKQNKKLTTERNLYMYECLYNN